MNKYTNAFILGVCNYTRKVATVVSVTITINIDVNAFMLPKS